jgi:hypothetical protein
MGRWLIGTILLVAAARPAAAQAPMMGGFTPTPMDLKMVATGVWAEYRTSVKGITVKSRWAFVGRDKDSNTLESIVDPGTSPAHKVTLRMVVSNDPAVAAEKRVKRMVIQPGDQDPMDLPVEAAASKSPPQKPDGKTLIGTEKVTVSGGTFTCKHYRYMNDNGAAEVWLSDDVPPIGIVKVQTTPPADTKDPMGRDVSSVTMELTAVGKDARATITKLPRRYDPAILTGLPLSAPKAPPPPTKNRSLPR